MKDYLETECVEKIKKECLLQVFDEIDSPNEYLSWHKDRQREKEQRDGNGWIRRQVLNSRC